MWAEVFFLLFCFAPLAMPFLTSPSCLCCGGGGETCDCCPSGTGPTQIEVTISGMANGACSNGDCANWDATFVLDYNADCDWFGDTDPVTTCSASGTQVTSQCIQNSPTSHTISVQISIFSGCGTCSSFGQWSKTFNPSTVDFCGGDLITLDTWTAPPFCTACCDFSGATVTVQAS